MLKHQHYIAVGVGMVVTTGTLRKNNIRMGSLENGNHRLSNVELILFSSYSVGTNYAKLTYIIQHTSNHSKMQYSNAKCPSPTQPF